MDVASTPHPTDQILSAFGLGKLDDRSAEAVNVHLETCAMCRKRAAETSADSFLARVREAQAGRSAMGQSPNAGTPSDQPAPPEAAPSTALPPGLTENSDYEIKKELGRGGMGVVYLAHNKLMGRDEVLKVMSRQIIEKPGVLDRFLREIRAVAKLRHPNIVTAYSATRIGETIVFSMEYVDGHDLSKMVKAKGQLSVAHACQFVYQAALGLQHAHEKGLVHRDIKPANLMLSKDGSKGIVKILDFGLAKATREEQVDVGLTSVGQALGTPDFIAPEQILDAQSADIRADIYSLGGTLYCLLTGRPPFQANSLYDIYQAHISRDADPLHLVRPEVPSELAALVVKMMAKDPGRRFPTPAEVAQALAPFSRRAVAGILSLDADLPRATEPPAQRPEPGASPPQTQYDTGMPSPALARTRGEAPPPEPLWATLIDTTAPESLQEELAPSSESEAARVRPRWPIVVAAAGLFALLWGIIIYFRHDEKGTTIAAGRPEDLRKAGITPQPKPEASAAQVSGESTSPKTAALEPVPLTEIAPRSEKPARPTEAPKAQSSAERKRDEERGPADSAPALPAPEERKVVSLFNGQDLTGWKTHPSQPGNWRVKNGVLNGSGPAATHLYTERGDFKDFHLRIEARHSEGGSGAVLFRSGFGPELPKDAPQFPKGFHATINSAHRFRGNTGGIYNGLVPEREWIANAKGTPVPPGEWFLLEILASSNNFEVFVNGRQSAYFQSSPSADAIGHLALQRQTPGAIFEFRSIQIREIGREKASPNQVACLTGHGRRVWSVAFSPDSELVLTGGQSFLVEGWGPGRWNWTGDGDNSVRLWEASSGRPLQTFPGHKPTVRATVFSRDGAFAASCGGWKEYQHLDVYEVAARRRIHELRPPPTDDHVAGAVTFSADGRQLRAASSNGTVQTWNLDNQQELPVIRLQAGMPQPNEFSSLLFTSDGNRLITGSQSGAVELWSVKTGERLRLYAGHAEAIRSLACSADDTLILSGAADNTARLWNVASGKQLRLLDCREDGLESLALSPDGRRALTGGRYGTIHVWDLANGRELGRLEGHTMRVGCLAFSPDGRRAVSGSDDKTARVWKLPAPTAP